MKNLKHYGLVAIAGLMMASAGCKQQPQPVGKIVGAKVVGWYRDGIGDVPGTQQTSILDLEGEELVLRNRNMFSNQVDTSMPLYNAGDTVWFRYDETTAKYGEVFADQVIDTAVYGPMDFYRKQQREIYGKKGK